MAPEHAISPALRTAQARLHELQAASRTRRLATNTAVPPTAVSSAKKLHETIQQLPDHLGWESTAVTTALRQHTNTPPTPKPVPHTSPPAPNFQPAPTITLHPTLAAAMLRQKLVTSGRVWLLLRHLDDNGCGWHTIEACYRHLTTDNAPHRLCGRRQLRNLLHEGEGIFWTRSHGRLWLRSVAKVAAALGVLRLSSRPIDLPIAILTAPIGTVRAHFYASFHSGRHSGKETAAPIARDTIAAITHVKPRIQRLYETRTQTKKQTNLAIGPAVNQADPQQIAWDHGHAAFQWTDYNGTQGEPGKRYWVWQLPNSYAGPHTRQPRAKQKRINRQLTDLPISGTAGTGQSTIERRYFRNGRLAAAHLAHKLTYWPGCQRRQTRIWHPLSPTRPPLARKE